jgi:hypothetical protein
VFVAVAENETHLGDLCGVLLLWQIMNRDWEFSVACVVAVAKNEHRLVDLCGSFLLWQKINLVWEISVARCCCSSK